MAGMSDMITLGALAIGGYILWTHKDEIQGQLDSLFQGGGGLGAPGGGGGGEEDVAGDSGGGGGGNDVDIDQSGGGGGGDTDIDVSGPGACACANGRCKGDCKNKGDARRMIRDISRKAGMGGGGGGGESYGGFNVPADFQGYGFDEFDMELMGDFPPDELNSYYTELDPWAGYRDAKHKYTSIYKRNRRYNKWYTPRMFT